MPTPFTRIVTVSIFGQQFEFSLWPSPCLIANSTQHLYVGPILAAVNYDRPWMTAVLLGWAAFDGRQGYLIGPEQLKEVLDTFSHAHIVLHDAVVNLKALQARVRSIDAYAMVERSRVWDTHLLSRSLRLATEGVVGDQDPRDTWKWCLELGTTDAQPTSDQFGTYEPSNRVPLRKQPQISYSPMLTVNQIPVLAWQTAAENAVLLNFVFVELWNRLTTRLSSASRCFGRLSPERLSDQVMKWGPQTHHIQLRAAIVLDRISENGMTVDSRRAAELHKEFQQQERHLDDTLRQYGYSVHSRSSHTALQQTLRRRERLQKIGPLVRDATGDIDTAAEALDVWIDDQFIASLLEHRQVRAILSNFLEKLDAGKTCLHPQFDPLKVTGRTSAFGEISAQNLPKSCHIRSCITASPRCVLLQADYGMIELVAFAYASESQFEYTSAMAVEIRKGRDLHQFVAAQLLGKSESVVTAEERRSVKPVIFGTPVGMGPPGIQRYARQAFDVQLDLATAAHYRQQIFIMFPEIKSFLRGDDGEFATGEAVAEFFNLTPRSYEAATGQAFGLQRWRGPDEPNPFLGFMALRAIASNAPETTAGRAYSPAEVDYFWRKIQARVEVIPKAFQSVVWQRCSSILLRQDVAAIAQRQSVMTLTGRLRAKASFTASRNTIFQGLAADGAKLALWLLWRAGYRIINFIHDEVLVEVPEDTDLHAHADRIRELMIAGMQLVIPDLPIRVKITAMRCWDARAEPVVDATERLRIWTSEDAGDERTEQAPHAPQGT